jgi:hypothetical protein
MDLKKISRYEENFVKYISDEEIAIMENKKIINGRFFQDSKCCFDFLNLSENKKVSLYIGNSTEDDERVFVEYTILMPDGRSLEDCFWSYSIIPLMTLEEIRALSEPRNFSLKLKIGIYSGTYVEKWEWQNVFTDAEDFSPLCSLSNFHSKCMEDLQLSGKFCDVTLVCDDKVSISAHRCFLIGSPYFSALFGYNFGKEEQNVVNCESDFETMEIILCFLYSGRIEEEHVVNWPDLYRVADFYQLDHLSRHCELQMMTRVVKTLEAIKDLLKFAITFHAYKLKRFLVVLIRRIQETT